MIPAGMCDARSVSDSTWRPEDCESLRILGARNQMAAPMSAANTTRMKMTRPQWRFCLYCTTGCAFGRLPA